MKDLAKQIASLRSQFNKNVKIFASVLPSGVKIDQLREKLINEVRNNPYLFTLDRASLLNCVIQAAKLGLEIGNGLGHAFIVPFKDICQLIVGYRGMLELARRSGEILNITAQAVYSNDLFDYFYSFEPKLRHVKSASDRGEIMGVYCAVLTTSGGKYLEFMNMSEIKSIQTFSESKKKNLEYKNPWRDHFDEMAKKTVIRKIFKILPCSTEITRAAIVDELAESGLQENYIETEFSGLETLEAQEEQTLNQIEPILKLFAKEDSKCQLTI